MAVGLMQEQLPSHLGQEYAAVMAGGKRKVPQRHRCAQVTSLSMYLGSAVLAGTSPTQAGSPGLPGV